MREHLPMRCVCCGDLAAQALTTILLGRPVAPTLVTRQAREALAARTPWSMICPFKPTMAPTRPPLGPGARAWARIAWAPTQPMPGHAGASLASLQGGCLARRRPRLGLFCGPEARPEGRTPVSEAIGPDNQLQRQISHLEAGRRTRPEGPHASRQAPPKKARVKKAGWSIATVGNAEQARSPADQ